METRRTGEKESKVSRKYFIPPPIPTGPSLLNHLGAEKMAELQRKVQLLMSEEAEIAIKYVDSLLKTRPKKTGDL